ncbi:MAG: hypothetical protein ACPG6P_13390 [Akkermansiaceae bacterium]
MNSLQKSILLLAIYQSSVLAGSVADIPTNRAIIQTMPSLSINGDTRLF